MSIDKTFKVFRLLHILFNKIRLLSSYPLIPLFLLLKATVAASLADFAACIEGSAQCVPLVGHRHFYDSDYTVMHRPSFMASLKMFSVGPAIELLSFNTKKRMNL